MGAAKLFPQPLVSWAGRPTRAQQLSAARFGGRDIFARPFALPPPAATIASQPLTPVHPPRPSLVTMDASLLPPVTVEVAHAPSPRADLIAGHVGPAVVVVQGGNSTGPVESQASAAPARKRQGNVVVQGGNSTGPVVKARARGANAAA
ncbi:hypothetical protein D1007_62228 [Hordeum vulgare]|nr:hypothetical protein D1007_62228 [Hordeum vulgare]